MAKTEEISTKNDNLPEYSVTEISGYIKKMVEENFSYIRVRGEISGLKIAPSGHAYFSLKDDNAVLSAICWRGTLSNLQFKPTEGLEVVCTGSVTTYPGQSKYQLTVHSIQPAGVGSLMALLEARKQQFIKEGLFAESAKKPLPFLPQLIGVITSPTGSVIKDILHRIEDRFPSHVLVWPVLVQGEQSAKQVADAINGFNKLATKPDVIIIARGGGSIEDLWSFNEEIVVRAAFASSIPIISAIGHETDTTLLDFVADIRAPTPTAAAELAVPVRSQILLNCQELGQRLFGKFNAYILHLETKLGSYVRGLPNIKAITENLTQKLDDLIMRLQESPNRYFRQWQDLLRNYASNLHINKLAQTIAQFKTTIDDMGKRLVYSFSVTLATNTQKLSAISALLDSYHYKNTLKRGFAIIKDQNNNIIKSTSGMKSGQKLAVEVSDGEKIVHVE